MWSFDSILHARLLHRPQRRANVTLFSTASPRTGSWSTVPYTWDGVKTTYISTNITSQSLANGAPIAEFSLQVGAGNYTISLNTPGCDQDGSCANRGIVNVTVESAPSSCNYDSNVNSLLYQNNKADKYDEVWSGYIPGLTGGFVPTVYLQAAQSQPIKDSWVTVVAQAVRLVQVGADDPIIRDECGRVINSTTPTTSNPSSNPAPPTTSQSTAQDTTGESLGTGAKAGIGIGIGIFVLLTILAALFVWRRRRRARESAATEGKSVWAGKSELPADDRPKHEFLTEKAGVSVKEMPAPSRPQELETRQNPVELPS